MLSDQQYQQSHLESFRRLPVPMRERCVKAIRDLFEDMPQTIEEIATEIQKNPFTWWAPYHYMWGMSMRNFLRDYYTDDQLPSALYPDDRGEYRNWDDYYVGIIEVAFHEGIYHLLDESEKI